MKKSFIMTISLVSVLAICMAVFAACGKKHNFSKTYTYDNEYHWHACTDKDCKEVKDKAKHTYGKWEVTKKPTATEKGARTRYCTVCKKKHTEEIAALQANPVTLKEGVMLDKKYDGKAVMFTKEQFKFMGNGAVTFMYKAGESEWTAVAPVAVGMYKVKVMVAETETYQAGVAEFDFEIKKGDNMITLKDGAMLGKVHDGNAVEITKDKFNVLGMGEVTFMFQKAGEEAWTAVAPSEVGKYKVKVMVAECMNYNAGEATFDFEIKKADNTITLKEGAMLGKTYDGTAVEITKEQFNIMGTGEVTFMFQKNGEETWSADAPMAAGMYKVKVMVAETEMYQAGEAMFDFEIKKADNTITLKESEMLGKTFDGTAVEITKEQFNVMGTGEVTFMFQKDGEETWSAEAPMAAGMYKVKVMVAACMNYNAGEATFDFEIKKADNTITLKEDVTLGKTYDGTAVEITKEKFNVMGTGEVTFMFQKNGEETWSAEAPMTAGMYKVKVMVAACMNYNAGEATFDFEIKKADNAITLKEDVTLGKVHDGNAVEITKDKFNVMGMGEVTFMFQKAGEEAWTAVAPVRLANTKSKSWLPSA